MIHSEKEISGESNTLLLQESSVHPSPIRVLAVDDEMSAARLLSIILSPPAFHCATAQSGEEALKALRSEQFDAVISDLHMPGISGMELLTQVRSLYPHLVLDRKSVV